MPQLTPEAKLRATALAGTPHTLADQLKAYYALQDAGKLMPLSPAPRNAVNDWGDIDFALEADQK